MKKFFNFRFPCRSGVNVFCAEHASQTVRGHERFFAPEVNLGRACAQARSFRSRFPSVDSGGMLLGALRKGCSLPRKAHRALRNGFPWQVKQHLRVWKDGLQKTNVSQRVEQRFSLNLEILSGTSMFPLFGNIGRTDAGVRRAPACTKIAVRKEPAETSGLSVVSPSPPFRRSSPCLPSKPAARRSCKAKQGGENYFPRRGQGRRPYVFADME